MSPWIFGLDMSCERSQRKSLYLGKLHFSTNKINLENMQKDNRFDNSSLEAAQQQAGK
jgi:hypothetical protein